MRNNERRRREEDLILKYSRVYGRRTHSKGRSDFIPDVLVGFLGSCYSIDLPAVMLYDFLCGFGRN